MPKCEMWAHLNPGGIWCHAASVGETRSIVTLLDEIVPRYPHTFVTNRSRRAVQARMPLVDDMVPRVAAPNEFQVRQFYSQTKPRLGIFVESELWPNLILQSPMPLMLVNGRMSDRSFQRWNRNFATRYLASLLLRRFSFLHFQTQVDEKRFRDLMQDKKSDIESCVGNLKQIKILKPEPVPPAVSDFLKNCGPAGWAGISLHPGEEEVLIRAHALFNSSVPLLLVPRHVPTAPVPTLVRVRENVYRVNAYGVVNEVCRWVHSGKTNFVFVGGSLSESEFRGGHNVFEPLNQGCLVGHGPHMFNFQLEEEVPPRFRRLLCTSKDIAELLLTLDQFAFPLPKFPGQSSPLPAILQAINTVIL